MSEIEVVGEPEVDDAASSGVRSAVVTVGCEEYPDGTSARARQLGMAAATPKIGRCGYDGVAPDDPWYERADGTILKDADVAAKPPTGGRWLRRLKFNATV